MTGDSGAVAVIVALLAVTLFGLGALVVDVGALYAERRELQNGADAAAFAVAQSCALGDCGDYSTDADDYGDSNALDGAARIPSGGVCGSTPAGTTSPLPVCGTPPTAAYGEGFVQVTTGTEEVGGGTVLPPFLARVLAPDYAGTDVGARAVVAWGPAASGASDFPITFDVCEWAAATGSAPVTKPPMPAKGGGGSKGGGGGNGDRTSESTAAKSDTVPDENGDVVLYMNDPGGGTAIGACAADANYKDAPGAFGWVTESPRDDQCAANSKVADQLAVDTGLNIPRECPEAYLASMVDKTIFLPIFSAVTGNGGNVTYEVAGYSPFFLTGFRLSGNVAAPAGDPPCDNPHRCLSGRFTTAIMSRATSIGSGPDLGATALQLVS